VSGLSTAVSSEEGAPITDLDLLDGKDSTPDKDGNGNLHTWDYGTDGIEHDSTRGRAGHGKDVSTTSSASSSMFRSPGAFPLTPESSVVDPASSTRTGTGLGAQFGAGGEGRDRASTVNLNTSAAVGVLVLSMAAAAVIWRVKPE